MKIALDDPVWNRLHSAYGVQDVAGPLRKLHDDWDSALANDLFWNNLHHQETLYPATYVALPWLWPLVDKHAESRSDLLAFFAHVVACTRWAHGDDVRKEQSTGVRVFPSDDGCAGIGTDASQHLSDADSLLVTEAEDWFRQMVPQMTAAFVAAMGKIDADLDAPLAQAVLYSRGCGRIAIFVGLWDGGFDLAEAFEEFEDSWGHRFEPDAHEIARTLAFSKEIAPSCPTVAAFLTGVIDAGLDRRDLVPTVQDDRQTSLFD